VVKLHAVNPADQVEFWRNVIRNTPEWIDGIKAKAEAGGLSLEDQLTRDADWMAGETKAKHKAGKIAPGSNEEAFVNKFLK
jgi:hypothetical protein